MIFNQLKYLEFEYILKKYGFKGSIKIKQLDEIASNKKNFFGNTAFKTSSLKVASNRIYSYMNNDLVMVKDVGQWSKLNEKIHSNGVEQQQKITMTYKTIEVLLLAFIFSKHENDDDMCDALWGLVNPEQSKYVSCERAGKFIEKLQKVAIDFPLKAEKSTAKDKAASNKQILKYLEECSSVKDKFLQLTMQEI